MIVASKHVTVMYVETEAVEGSRRDAGYVTGHENRHCDYNAEESSINYNIGHRRKRSRTLQDHLSVPVYERGYSSNYQEGGLIRGAFNLLRNSISFSTASKVDDENAPTEEQAPLCRGSREENDDAVHRFNYAPDSPRQSFHLRSWNNRRNALRSSYTVGVSANSNNSGGDTRSDKLHLRRRSLDPNTKYVPARPDLQQLETLKQLSQKNATASPDADATFSEAGGDEVSSVVWREPESVFTTASVDGSVWRVMTPPTRQARFLPPSSSLCGRRCACPRCSVAVALGGGGSTPRRWQQGGRGGLAALQKARGIGRGTKWSRLAQVTVGCDDADLRDHVEDIDKQKEIEQQEEMLRKQQEKGQQQQPNGWDNDLVSSTGSSGGRCCYICLVSGPPPRHDADMEAGDRSGDEDGGSSSPPARCPCVCASLYVHSVCLRVWRQQTKYTDCSVCHTPWTDQETFKKELEEVSEGRFGRMSHVVVRPSSSYENSGEVVTPYPTWPTYCWNAFWALLVFCVCLMIMSAVMSNMAKM